MLTSTTSSYAHSQTHRLCIMRTQRNAKYKFEMYISRWTVSTRIVFANTLQRRTWFVRLSIMRERCCALQAFSLFIAICRINFKIQYVADAHRTSLTKRREQRARVGRPRPYFQNIWMQYWLSPESVQARCYSRRSRTVKLVMPLNERREFFRDLV